MLNLIFSVLQQECKQESENLDKGRITGSASSLPRKKLSLPLNGGQSHAFSFLDLGRSETGMIDCEQHNTAATWIAIQWPV